MESEPDSTIGIIFDHPDYSEKLNNLSGLKLISLPLCFDFPSHSLTPKEFYYNNTFISCAIIYASVKMEYRQNNYGLEWIKKFRLAGFNTSIIVLSWFSGEVIEKYYGITNPFIIRSQSNSLKILQLPVTIQQIQEAIELLSPLTEIEFQKQFAQFNTFEANTIKHDLRNIIRTADDLWDMKRKIIKYFSKNSRKEKYNSFLQVLLSCSSTESLIEKIEFFK